MDLKFNLILKRNLFNYRILSCIHEFFLFKIKLSQQIDIIAILFITRFGNEIYVISD